MASFDATVFDAEAAWEERLEAMLPGPGQVRESPEMGSAKVTVLTKGTVVKVHEMVVLGNGTVRVRVEPTADAGLGGWLSAKILVDWRAAPRSRGPLKEIRVGDGGGVGLTSAKTLAGVHFVRGVVGAPGTEDPTILLFLHGGGYNCGVWLPVIAALHSGCLESGDSYECIAIDWIGHGRGRKLPGSGSGGDRFDIAKLGAEDVFSVLDDAGDEDGAFRVEGRRVVGVGHSNGAMILAHAETRRPGSFAGFVWYEPIIYEKDAMRTTADDNFAMLEQMAAKRKYEFEVAPEDNFSIAAAYFDRALGDWESDARRYYVEFGMREVRRVGSAKVVLYCPKDVEKALFANTPAAARAAFAGLPTIACATRVACGEASRSLGNSTLVDETESLARSKANYRAIASRVANPLARPIPGFGGDWCGPVGICPGARHDIPQINAKWTADYLLASLRHDHK